MFRKKEGKGLKINLKKSLLVVLAAGMLVVAPVSAYATEGVGGNNGVPTDQDYSGLDDGTYGDDGMGGNSDDSVQGQAYSALAESIYDEVSENLYTVSGGGNYSGKEIVDKDTGLVNDRYTELTSKSRQQLLNDMNKAADAKVSDDKGEDPSSSTVTEDTKNNW